MSARPTAACTFSSQSVLLAITTPSALRDLPMFLGIRADQTALQQTEVVLRATKADLLVAQCTFGEHQMTSADWKLVVERSVDMPQNEAAGPDDKPRE
jgi:hypothetical protein